MGSHTPQGFPPKPQSTVHGLTSSSGHGVPGPSAEMVMFGDRFCFPVWLLHSDHFSQWNRQSTLQVFSSGSGQGLAPSPNAGLRMFIERLWRPELLSHSPHSLHTPTQSCGGHALASRSSSLALHMRNIANIDVMLIGGRGDKAALMNCSTEFPGFTLTPTAITVNPASFASFAHFAPP